MPLLRKDVQLHLTDREPNRSAHVINDHVAHSDTHTLNHDKPHKVTYNITDLVTHHLAHNVIAYYQPNEEPDMRAVQRVRRCAVISL